MLSTKVPDEVSAQLPQMGAAMVDDLRDMLAVYINQRQEMTLDDGIATIHAYGPMIQDGSPLDLALGRTGYEEIISDIQTANASGGAKAIIMVADTPGGMVDGIKETVAAMDASIIPIYGYNAGSATSAGYYLLAGTEHITVSESSQTGNIGTVLAWLDDSAFMESLGFKMEVMTNEGADLKGTFRDDPMTDSQREFLQDGLNQVGAEFHEHVFSHRPQVSQEVTRAGWYSPEDSIALGLADEVGTLADLRSAVKQTLDIE